MPVATATAEPPLEPPGMRVGSWGLRLCGLVTPRANSWVVGLGQDDRPGGPQPGDAESASVAGTSW